MLVFLLIVLSILGAGLLLANYFYNLTLNPHSDKQRVLRSLPNDGGYDFDSGMAFWASCVPEDVYRTARDGLMLHALKLPAEPESGWVIIAHGYTSAARHMGSVAERFREMGYSLLLPDARGHGESEGGYIGMGWPERLDILGWIDDLLQTQPDAKILLYGISMGAATMMMTAGEPLPPNVRGVIEDCGYTSVTDEFFHQLTHTFHLPAFLARFIIFFAEPVARLRAGYSLRAASSVAQLEKMPRPLSMLFIHGEQDTYVPFWMLDTVYAAAATEDKQKLSFPGAAHGLSAVTDPARYWGAVQAFADRVMR